jgi:TPR repeat protein
VAKDPTHGFELLLRAATAGLDISQVDVGLAYLNGNAVSADPETGIKWLKRAVKHDLASAHFILGIAYENGQGVDTDYRKAAEHYRKAADQGVAAAKNNLGRLYLRGQGVAADRREAFRLFSESAEGGNEQSYLNLAFCHLTGCTGVIDVTEAFSWYLRAQKAGTSIPEPFAKKFSSIGQELTQDQLQAAQMSSDTWIAQHPAVDPRSPLQLNHVPTPTLMAREPRTLQNDEVLKTLWQPTQYTLPRSSTRDSVR